MQLIQDLNWLLPLVLFVMGNSPLIFIDKPIKDRRWWIVIILFNMLGIIASLYLIISDKGL